MRVIVALETRFVRDPSGDVWSAATTASFWERYLAVFDEVLVAARVLPVDSAPEGWHRVSRPDVAFHPVPYYVGPAQFVRRWWTIRRSLAGLVAPADAVILRIGSQVAAMIEPNLRRADHPYGVEVVGDPWDVFAPGVVRHPLRPALRRYFSRQMRRQCRDAVALGYVTAAALQRRYPPSPGAFATAYSSIDLQPEGFVSASRPPSVETRRRTLVFVGSVEQLYKAPDVLLRALHRCVERGVDLDLDLVGGGRQLATLRDLAAELGLGERVRFHGELPGGEPIRRLLDAADLFVLPSRTEGLPRAMLEAMARALPCLGSTAGGIPELLPASDLVPPDDVTALTTAIEAVLTDPERMATMSSRNLAKAAEYRADILQGRREAMYRHLRDATAAHATEGGNA